MKTKSSRKTSRRPERVLAFGCHPDDVEYSVSGTLALLARKGYEIHIAEGFIQHLGSGHSTDNLLKKILGDDLCVELPDRPQACAP